MAIFQGVYDNAYKKVFEDFIYTSIVFWVMLY